MIGNDTHKITPVIILLRNIALAVLLLMGMPENQLHAQGCPPNIDFEQGNFTGWDCFIGNTRAVGGQNVIHLNPSPPIPGRHEIINAATIPVLDVYGNFPVLCPYGGTTSVKLGNATAGALAEGLSYTFIVPPGQDTFSFTYFYAVVFQNPDHNDFEQPRFFVSAYDVLTGETISCASYNYVSTSGIPGFEVSAADTSVLFKPWSPVSIKFAGLANRQVRLEFKTADCTRGGHFGYAYVDVSAGCSNTLATAPYCIEANELILNAPFGYQSYTWYNHDYSAVVGRGQTVSLSPPPVTSGTFHVDMVPYPGFGCQDTVDAVVVPLPIPDTPDAVTEIAYCQFAQAQPLTAVNLPGHFLLWYADSVGGTGTATAPVPSTSALGNYFYYVSQKELFGCESRRNKIIVRVLPVPAPAFTVQIDKHCVYENHFTFINRSANLLNAVYEWDFGDGQTQQTTGDTVTHSYIATGNYGVKLKVINESGCSAQTIQPVTVHPRPVPVIVIPPVICENQTPISLTDQSFIPGGAGQITNWWWSLNGAPTSVQQPPPFTVSASVPFTVQLAVTSSYGCISDTVTQQLLVRHKPVALFRTGNPVCENEIVSFFDQSTIPGGTAGEIINQWSWQFAAGGSAGVQHPQTYLPAGMQPVSLSVTSGYGCISNRLDTTVLIHAKPSVVIHLSDSCAKKTIQFTPASLSGTVTNWYWNFGSGFQPGGTIVPKLFSQAGSGVVRLVGETVYGCKDTVSRAFTIYDNLSFAGNDTSGPVNEPVQLNANGGSNIQYLWSPPDGLSDARIENPTATLNRDMLYNLYSISDKGCVARSKIFILRYKGPDIYVPTAFSPNNDGVNDLFRAVAYGVTQFDYLAVYNRYGNEVFRATDIRRGWDGTYKGTPVEPGAYVYMAHGTDFKGREISKKGTVVLIR